MSRQPTIGRRSAEPLDASFRSNRKTVTSAPGLAGARAAPPSPSSAFRAQTSSEPGSAITLAEGVSHPDGDERLSPSKPASDPAPSLRTAQVSAAPTTPASVPSMQPAAVQGFGSEMAVPPTADGDRPGGTRRRSHPVTWPPEAMTNAPEPLEEREAITAAAVSAVVLPDFYDRGGRLIIPPPLKGSHDVLLHQNIMAAHDGLERIQDDADLERLRAAHQLVGFQNTVSLRINDELPGNRRVARPWTAQFTADIASAFYARFHEPIYVTSAVRTVHFQARLQKVNGNAAAVDGEAASPHLTGQAIDFGKRGMSQAQLAWMRWYLLPLMHLGSIDVEEEFRQACFHISVYRSYAGGRLPRSTMQQAHSLGFAEPASVPSIALP